MQPDHTLIGRLSHVTGKGNDGGDVHTLGSHAGQFFVGGDVALSGFLWRHVMAPSRFAVLVRKHNDSTPGRLAEVVSGRI